MVTPEDAVERISQAMGGRTGKRTLHAKGRFYSGSFTATPEATALCRAAHLTGAAVPTMIRFSNGSGRVSADRVPDVRGMAVSFRPEGGGATDILGQTAPRFPVQTPEEFVKFTLAAAAARSKPWVLLGYLAAHPKSVPAIVANGKAGAIKPPNSFAATTYYAVHAFKWLDAEGGSRWVRYTWLPDQDAQNSTPDTSDRDYLFTELESRLAIGPVRMRLRVQVAADGEDPHDPMSVWKSKEHLDAGTLEITAADPERETKGDIVVFDPTKVIDGIELSDDPILRFRSPAYSASVNRRV